MSDIKQREEKIKARRKQTNRKEFVLHFLSYYAFSLYKKPDGKITAFSPKYMFPTVDPIEFEDQRDAHMKL